LRKRSVAKGKGASSGAASGPRWNPLAPEWRPKKETLWDEKMNITADDEFYF